MTAYQPLTTGQIDKARELIGDVRRAEPSLVVELAQSVNDRRTHDHPTINEDWFCNNLSGWAGDKAAVVLQRLLDAETALAAVTAERDAALAEVATAKAAGYRSAAANVAEMMDLHGADFDPPMIRVFLDRGAEAREKFAAHLAAGQLIAEPGA
jgi:hypothetical protein